MEESRIKREIKGILCKGRDCVDCTLYFSNGHTKNCTTTSQEIPLFVMFDYLYSINLGITQKSRVKKFLPEHSTIS